MLCYAPLWDNLYAGQINTFVLLLLALTLACSRRGREFAAGSALAGAIVLKATPALLLLHFAAVRQWRALATGIGVVAALTAAAAAVWGGSIVSGYVAVVRETAATTFTFSNLGVLALLERLFDAPAAAWLHRGLFALAIVHSLRRGPVFERLVVVMTLFAPIVWYHHMVFLVIPFLTVWRSRPLLGWFAIACVQIERAVAYRCEALTACPTLLGAALLYAALRREAGTAVIGLPTVAAVAPRRRSARSVS